MSNRFCRRQYGFAFFRSLTALAFLAVLTVSAAQARVKLVGATDFDLKNALGGEIDLPIEYDPSQHDAVIVAVVKAIGPDGPLPASTVKAKSPCEVNKGVGTCRLKVSPVAFAKQGRYMIEVHAIAGGPSTALDTMQLDVVRTESSVDMEVKGGSLINVPVGLGQFRRQIAVMAI
jgi:hypothetical protein